MFINIQLPCSHLKDIIVIRITGNFRYHSVSLILFACSDDSQTFWYWSYVFGEDMICFYPVCFIFTDISYSLSFLRISKESLFRSHAVCRIRSSSAYRSLLTAFIPSSFCLIEPNLPSGFPGWFDPSPAFLSLWNFLLSAVSSLSYILWTYTASVFWTSILSTFIRLSFPRTRQTERSSFLCRTLLRILITVFVYRFFRVTFYCQRVAFYCWCFRYPGIQTRVIETW